MRASLLFSTLVLYMPVANAQDYLAGEPIWLQHSVCAVPLPCIATDTYNYYTVGDSIIEGVTWTKVKRAGMVSYSWQSTPPVGPGCLGTTTYETDYFWLIRQNGQQLRIWVNDADELLHEFDLQVGDTVPLSYTNWNTDITVLAIDYVQIGSETRVRYELSNSWAQYLIEGVGSSNGLFEPLSNFLECGYGLDCFGLGSENFYPEATGESCLLAMGVSRLTEERALGISPNPAGAMVQVTGGSAGQSMTLLDATGRVVMVAPCTGPQASLDLQTVPSGSYTVMVGGRAQRLLVAR